jgi:hypothetical protein
LPSAPARCATAVSTEITKSNSWIAAAESLSAGSQLFRQGDCDSHSINLARPVCRARWKR